MLRICLISREYPTAEDSGGIGTYTEKTARVLAALGHIVDVITEAPEARVSVEENVTVHRLPTTRVPHLKKLFRARAVSHAVRRLDPAPDIVQACEYGAEAVWYAFRKPRRTRLVTRLATPSFLVRELNENGRVSSMATRRYTDGLERLQTSRSDAVIAISRALGETVGDRWHIPGSRLSLVKTGVDFSSRYATDAGVLPPRLDGCEYLLFFGRLEERKGVHVLAQALPDVLAQHPRTHVVFAGTPLPYHGRPMDAFVRECNAEHADRLHFLPRQPARDLYPLLANAVLVVLPSLWEGLGNVALESIDMGKPVVATSGSGFDDVIEDGWSGLLVPPGEVEPLRGALLKVLDDGELQRRLAGGAKARAEQFELTRVVGELVEFYERLLSEPAGRSAGVVATM